MFIIQPLVPPVQEHLMELLLMLDAARGASAARITAVIPHFAYARSDKKDAPRISIAARLVADLLATAGANRVLTMTLHSPQVHGFFSVPVDHMNALEGAGAALPRRRPEEHGRRLAGSRQREGGVALRAHARAAGGRRQQAAPERRPRRHRHDRRRCRRQERHRPRRRDRQRRHDRRGAAASCASGGSKRIAVACTHGLFTGKAIERLRAQPDIDEIVTTDTVPLPAEKRLPNMTVLSIAPLLAEAIRRIHVGESVSGLFDGTG